MSSPKRKILSLLSRKKFKSTIIVTSILIVTCFLCCTVFRKPLVFEDKVYSEKPLIKVRIPKSTDKITLSSEGGLWLLNQKDEVNIDDDLIDLELKTEKLPEYRYKLTFGKFENYQNAVNLREKFLSNGIDVEIEKSKELELDKSLGVIEKDYFILSSQEFGNIEDLTDFRLKNDIKGNLRKILSKEGRGSIICNSEDKRYSLTLPLFIYPTNKDSPIKIISGKKLNIFDGYLYLNIDKSGNLRIVNYLEIDDYLSCVVAVEMNPDWHLEALKAQAVLSRTLAYKKYLSNYFNQDYYIEGSTINQVYEGLKEVSPKVAGAVKTTAGIVILNEGELAEVVFSGCCGGVISDPSDYWSDSNDIIISNIEDSPLKRKVDLSKETDFRMWMNKDKNVYCNTENMEKSFEVSWEKSVYKWNSIISAGQIRNNIRLYFSKDIGEIIDVYVYERSKSGNVLILKIVGLYNEISIDNPQNIRRVLNVKSAKFIVKREKTDEIMFHISGVGSGHGVGLCQLGALGMAIKGNNYDEILNHYFKNISLDKIY